MVDQPLIGAAIQSTTGTHLGLPNRSRLLYKHLWALRQISVTNNRNKWHNRHFTLNLLQRNV